MKPPLVFVSYSHDSSEHQEWVRTVIVNGLRSRGVDARMDVYELSYGDKIDEFIEKFAESCDHILAICTPNYADRSAHDTGGVGYEKQLIRRFMARRDPQHKVIPILRSGGEAAIPPYMGTRLYVDIQSDDHMEDLLDALATVLYGVQLHQAPPVATPPPWLQEKLSSAAESPAESRPDSSAPSPDADGVLMAAQQLEENLEDLRRQIAAGIRVGRFWNHLLVWNIFERHKHLLMRYPRVYKPVSDAYRSFRELNELVPADRLGTPIPADEIQDLQDRVDQMAHADKCLLDLIDELSASADSSSRQTNS